MRLSVCAAVQSMRMNMQMNSCLCKHLSSASFQQVKRGVGGETGEVVVMPTKARHRTGAAVVMAAERGTNEKEVLRS